MFQPSWNKNFSVVSVLGPIITHFLSAFTRVYIRFFPGWIQCTSPMMMHNEFSSLGLTDKTGIFLGVAKTSHHNSPLLKETRSWGEFNFAKTSGSITREQEKANSWPARPHVRPEGFFFPLVMFTAQFSTQTIEKKNRLAPRVPHCGTHSIT